jgi:pSer/pThr/pTyr-binding forkhead associated (FHA) protein
MPALKCSRCSTQNPSGSLFCRACGEALTAGAKAAGNTTRRPKVAMRVVRADGGPEVVVAMGGDELSCGRCGDIALDDDPFVASVQARFFFSGQRLAVQDVGGGNGVFLRLRREHELPSGGELRLGRERLLLEPMPPIGPGPGGVMVWGSTDPGYRFRLIQSFEGGRRGAAFPLKEGQNLLGRESGDITFPGDGFISGRHAMLEVRQDRLFVKDLNSSNGTFVRVFAPTLLDNADQLLIGRELLKVEIGTG